MLKMVGKPIYRIILGPDGPIPIIETQNLFIEDPLIFFREHELLEEDIQDSEKYDFALTPPIIEEISTSYTHSGVEEISQTIDSRSFNINYVNPITQKTETIHSNTKAISTEIKNPIDSSIYKRTYGNVYKFVVSPIYVERIDQYILDKINKEVEIVEPKPFGGGVVVPLKKIIKETKAKELEIKAVKKKELVVALTKRQRSINRSITSRIVAIELAIKASKKKRHLKTILSKLPKDLRRIFLLRLIPKKKVDNQVIEMMLLEDVGFLEKLKIKLKKMNLKELLKILKKLSKGKQKKKD